MKKYSTSLAHSIWECKYYIVVAPKYRKQIIYGKKQTKYWNNYLKIV